MEIREILAANLKRERKVQGLSQEALADKIGINRTYLSRMERRVNAVSIDMLARLAQAVDKQPYELLIPTTRASPSRASSSALASPGLHLPYVAVIVGESD
jgi:transcriptional regulator with XRE-family HTH domain